MTLIAGTLLAQRATEQPSRRVSATRATPLAFVSLSEKVHAGPPPFALACLGTHPAFVTFTFPLSTAYPLYAIRIVEILCSLAISLRVATYPVNADFGLPCVLLEEKGETILRNRERSLLVNKWP